MQKHLLRSFVLSIVLCLTSIVSKAQWITIPDPSFVSYLQATFPSCMNGNLMDTTCSGVVNATQVGCSNSLVRDITGISYFDNLQYLFCESDSLTFLPALPATLIHLSCRNNRLSSLPTLPNTLIALDCLRNPNLTVLPVLPNTLSYLNCQEDSLVSLPVLPNTLTNLFCAGNYLTLLPTLSSSLQFLNCTNNQISSLPVLPVTLQGLTCSYNPLSLGLPNLPNALLTLSCNNNSLTTLPPLPVSLQILECISNNLGGLPSLPLGLKELNFSDNPIVNFPLFPDSLLALDCSSTQATALPMLPSSLRSLSCEQNPLLTLPDLPDSLTFLYASFCNFTSLPEFPDSLSSCWIANNPNLHCLPRLKRIVSLDFTNTGMTCLPNYGNITSSNPVLTSIPLCDPFNANGCSVYWNINGKVYNDTSGNCIKDIGETNVQNMKVNLYENGVLTQQNYSGGYGIYSFDTDMGTFETSVDTTGVPFDILCPASRFDTSFITALDSFDYDRDFAMQCKPGFDVGAWSLVSNNNFRPARIAFINIHAGDWAQFWGQNCNTNNLSGQLVTTISGAATFISAAAGALIPAVSGNTLTYNISNWSAVNPNTDFNIVVQTDTTAPLGSQICFDVNATPVAGDNNASNNHLSHCFTVVSSYDPNEKEVSPVSSIDANGWLTYTIHFQNTGTATAEHIYVTDTLDTNVDAGTFQLLAYSHQPMVQLKENAVRFNFPNINLPDSNANEAASHGYVQYKVKLKNNLLIGTHISNTAFIYFDFNTAVVTNTTSNTITTATAIKEFGMQNLEFRMNPNPASSFVNISIDESMVGSNLSVYDITGRKMASVQLSLINYQLSISRFASGVYFVTVENERGRVTKKLVIEK